MDNPDRYTIGIASGALSGALTDVGIDDDLIRELGKTLEPFTSASRADVADFMVEASESATWVGKESRSARRVTRSHATCARSALHHHRRCDRHFIENFVSAREIEVIIPTIWFKNMFSQN
jgi:hypothetical protein